MTRLVHPGELEDKVCQSAEEKDNGKKHSELVLPSRPECCHNEDDDSDRDSGDRNPFLGICDVVDDNEELYSEAQEEEEIELQQSNVNLYNVSISLHTKFVSLWSYLECQETTLHSEVCADMLVDCPRKLIVQFPRLERHYKAEERDDARNCQKIWPDCGPDRIIRQDVYRNQTVDSFFDLVILNGRINEHATVVHA